MFFACIAGASIILFRIVVVTLDGTSPFFNYQFTYMASVGDCCTDLDYISPVLGTKYAGGSKGGNRGCMIGTVAGLFVFPPWGILIGPFVGAVIGELISGKQSVDAVQAGFGAFLGFLFSVVAKESLCGYFLYCFVAAFI